MGPKAVSTNSNCHALLRMGKACSSHRRLVLAGCVWLILLGVGFGMLMVYSQTPGDVEAPPVLSVVDVKYDSSAPTQSHTLVMAVHPRCPCTKATMSELERLKRHCGDQLSCVLLVYHPADAADDWMDTAVIAAAKRVPNIVFVKDVEGKQAARMGAFTSGSSVLYDRKGEPQFWGGITAARNHAGDNMGFDAIKALVNAFETRRTEAPVYGCALGNGMN